MVGRFSAYAVKRVKPLTIIDALRVINLRSEVIEMYILEYVSKFTGTLVTVKRSSPEHAERTALSVGTQYYVIYQNEN